MSCKSKDQKDTTKTAGCSGIYQIHAEKSSDLAYLLYGKNIKDFFIEAGFEYSNSYDEIIFNTLPISGNTARNARRLKDTLGIAKILQDEIPTLSDSFPIALQYGGLNEFVMAANSGDEHGLVALNNEEFTRKNHIEKCGGCGKFHIRFPYMRFNTALFHKKGCNWFKKFNLELEIDGLAETIAEASMEGFSNPTLIKKLQKMRSEYDELVKSMQNK